ncbi:dynamin family protein [Actibacterium sp. 188UL27-1]|nr:dynamin family protein [Actibacterium sp. 188UL27-1]
MELGGGPEEHGELSALAPRKPRIALMGEFSAGKSTLSNLLLGARPLPEKVTATRLSPVWMSHGTAAAHRVSLDGEIEEIKLHRIEEVPVEETKVIRVFLDADILEVCDLIDFPGISDPNMSSEVWQRVVGEVDAVLWCTHATQAWRQSEAAVWDDMPEAVRENSVLLITRWDKLTTEKDQSRVRRRIEKETRGLFGATFPISLTRALAAGDDYDKWVSSGAEAFTNHLIDLVKHLGAFLHTEVPPLYQVETLPDEMRKPIARSKPVAGAANVTSAHGAVAPRRVDSSVVGNRTARPARRSAAEARNQLLDDEVSPATPGPDPDNLRSVFVDND